MIPLLRPTVLVVTFALGCSAIAGSHLQNPGRAALPVESVHRLPDGSMLEIVAITNNGFTRSWKPNGAPILISKARLAYNSSPQFIHQQTISILFRLTLPKHQDKDFYPMVTTEPEPGNAMVMQTLNDRRIWEGVRKIQMPRHGARQDIVIRIADKDWTSVATSTYRNKVRVSGPVFGSRLIDYRNEAASVESDTTKTGTLTPSQGGYNKAFKVLLDIPLRFANTDWQCFAIQRDRNQCQNSGHSVNPSQKLRVWQAFIGDSAKVTSISLGVRPIRSVVFKNVIVSR